VDSLKKDGDIKLLFDCTEKEITLIDTFFNTGEFMSGFVIRRKTG
jgi:hypothetical protein